MPTPTKDGLRHELDDTLDELRTLRDEIRLQIHLGGMEAKTRWDRDLEPKLFSMEKRVEREVNEATHVALAELRENFRKFRDALNSKKN